jgi:hypothetical protein
LLIEILLPEKIVGKAVSAVGGGPDTDTLIVFQVETRNVIKDTMGIYKNYNTGEEELSSKEKIVSV